MHHYHLFRFVFVVSAIVLAVAVIWIHSTHHYYNYKLYLYWYIILHFSYLYYQLSQYKHNSISLCSVLKNSCRILIIVNRNVADLLENLWLFDSTTETFYTPMTMLNLNFFQLLTITSIISKCKYIVLLDVVVNVGVVSSLNSYTALHVIVLEAFILYC